MKLLNYKIKKSIARHKWSHMKLHRYNDYWHFVWGKFSLQGGKLLTCDYCSVSTDIGEYMCQECYEKHFCECGTKLDDFHGGPGVGFCRKCS